MFSPGSMHVTICCCHQVDFIFCFHSKTMNITAKRWQSSRHHPEAVAVGLWKLVVVGVQKVVASRGWWWQETTTTMAGLTVLIFAPGSMWITIHCCHQVDFIFCFYGKATDTTTKKQSNMYHLEAVAVSFWKLVAVSVWKVVASGGWWWQKCHHYHGWVDCSHFFHPKAGRLPYATAARLILFFVFVARQQMPLPPWPLQGVFFQGTPLLLLLVNCSFLHPEACGLQWPD